MKEKQIEPSKISEKAIQRCRTNSMQWYSEAKAAGLIPDPQTMYVQSDLRDQR